VSLAIVVFDVPLDGSLDESGDCTTKCLDKQIDWFRRTNQIFLVVGDASGSAVIDSNNERIGVVAMVFGHAVSQLSLLAGKVSREAKQR
jgi:hypothetical protein